jgi:hypothetical protein
VANTCNRSPAVFCYDLMNEPVVCAIKAQTWKLCLWENLGGHI